MPKILILLLIYCKMNLEEVTYFWGPKTNAVFNQTVNLNTSTIVTRYFVITQFYIAKPQPNSVSKVPASGRWLSPVCCACPCRDYVPAERGDRAKMGTKPPKVVTIFLANEKNRWIRFWSHAFVSFALLLSFTLSTQNRTAPPKIPHLKSP